MGFSFKILLYTYLYYINICHITNYNHMTIQLIRQSLSHFIKSNIRSATVMIRSRYPNIYRHIVNNYEGNTFKEKCYVAINGKNNICPISNKQTKFLSFELGYQKYYSNKEAAIGSKNKRLSRMKEAFVEKYGVEHYSHTEEFAEKIKLKHSDGMYDYDAITKKSKDTRLRKYGTENYNNKEKNKNTKKTRYGDEYYNNRPKAKATSMNNYGVSNYNKLPERRRVLSKLQISKRNERIQAYCKKNNLEWMDKSRPSTYLDSKGIKRQEYFTFSCNECDNSFEASISNGAIPVCPNCNPKTRSKVQNEIAEFIREFYNGKVETDQRKYIAPQELDIILPAMNLAIELDGVYYHTEVKGGKDKTYHLNKTLKANEEGLDVIHIFDNEWNYKQDIVKSILKNRIQGPTVKINGRDTEVVEITSKESNEFLNENHIQGEDRAPIRIALKRYDEIVSVMTFGKSRYGKDTEFEMYRYCNKLNVTVRGGANKLFKYFIKNYNPKSIKTFSDRRYFNGNVYKSLGFNFKEYTKPNYFYTKNFIQLESRQRYQKHKLSDILDHFDSSKTEFENMVANGYDRIWDCGNSKFVWTK